MAIPLWFTTSQGPFAIVLTPLSVNLSTGALTPGTPVTLTADVDQIRLRSTPRKREISGLAATRENDVITKERTEVTLAEILKFAGTNKLAAQVMAGKYFQLDITRGAQAWSFQGIRGDYDEDLVDDKSLANLTLTMIDPGTTNPTYT